MDAPLKTPDKEAKFHVRAAIAWFLLGLFGVGQLILNPEELRKTYEEPIAASIAVLYFISVYANVVGHWSGYQAAKVERENDAQMQEVMSDLDAIKEKLGIK